MKNIIIGYGETLTKSVKIKNGSGPKKHPYSLQEARKRMEKNLSQVMIEIDGKPDQECANNEVVVKFIQHPTYLAKTYYPKGLFRKFGMRDVGSCSMKIKPEKWAVKDHPEEGMTCCIYVSGKKEQYHDLLKALRNNKLEEATLKRIQTIEQIECFEGKDKIKGLIPSSGKSKLEVGLHASVFESSIIEEFFRYLTDIGGNASRTKIKTVGGLTFLPVEINNGDEEKLAKFSHLRVLRSIPRLRFNNPEATRTIIEHNFKLPRYEELNHDFKVCIFDGGLGEQHLLNDWVNETIPKDVKSWHPELLSHGSEVCSTYLFGPYNMDSNSLGSPYTNVDIVRVLSPDDTDTDLFDVLTRIEDVLKTEQYKYINLSLGPRIAIDDDDVNVWTSVLDSYLQKGNCLATVAIGNDGDLNGDDARIQPPSDMVNSLAIGSCDSLNNDWKRSPFSCIGPGRSPGLIKPDGLMFGGGTNNFFPVYSPITHKIVGTQGTSYSAPYAMRVAAGIDAITDIDLSPSTIKALMVHNTHSNGISAIEAGWGKFPNSPEEVIECLDDEATIIYQGELTTSEHLRIPIPIPHGLNCTWVHLKATFCINSQTDPEHPLHYTRGGLDIVFRSNDSKFKNEDSEHPNPTSFFTCGSLYPDEHELREDAHKWETCISRQQRFKKTTLVNPMFDVRYQGREQGGSPSSALEPIKYSLILTVRAEGDNNLYNSVLQQNQTLQSIKIRHRIRVDS
ncbi:TPA: S8 family peptidase [Photobacterium damselae]